MGRHRRCDFHFRCLQASNHIITREAESRSCIRLHGLTGDQKRECWPNAIDGSAYVVLSVSRGLPFLLTHRQFVQLIKPLHWISSTGVQATQLSFLHIRCQPHTSVVMSAEARKERTRIELVLAGTLVGLAAASACLVPHANSCNDMRVCVDVTAAY